MDVISLLAVIGLWVYGLLAFGIGFSLVDGCGSGIFFSIKPKDDEEADDREFIIHVREVESAIGFVLIVSSLVSFLTSCIFG